MEPPVVIMKLRGLVSRADLISIRRVADAFDMLSFVVEREVGKRFF